MRFYKPGKTEYQSQFAPLDLNFIQKIGAAKDTQSYEVDDLLDKADQLKIDAGMFSKKEEVDQYNQWLKDNVTSTRDQLLNQEITEEEAARNISKINSVLTNSEAVKFFNADRKVTEEIRKGMVAGKYNQGISTNFNYLDPNNPQITPISYTEGIDALVKAGNIKTPTSINAKENYEQNYKDLKGSLYAEEWGNKNGLDIRRTTDGLPYVVNSKTGFMDKNLTYQMVYDRGLQMAGDELRNASTPYVQYQFGKYGKENYKPENFARDFANNFTGIFSEHTQTSADSYNVLEGLAAQEAAAKKVQTTPLANRALTKGTVTNTKGIKNIAEAEDRLTRIINRESTGGGVEKPRPGAASTGPAISVGTSVTFADMPEQEFDLLEKFYRSKGENAVVDNILAPAKKAGKEMLRAVTDKFPMKKGENKDWDRDGLTPLADAFKEMKETGYLDANLSVTTFENEGVTDIIDPSILGIRGKVDKNLTLEDLSTSFLSQNISIIDGSTMKELTKGDSSNQFFSTLGYTLGTDKLADVPAVISRVDPDNSLRVASSDKASWGNAIKITVLSKEGKFKTFYAKDLKQSSTNPDPNIREQENTQIAYKENVNNLINEVHSLQFEPNGEKVYLDPNEPSKYVYAIREKDKQGKFKAYWYHSDNPNRKYTNSEAVTRYSLKLDVDKSDYIDKPAAGKK
jgi:hypothetical protein